MNFIDRVIEYFNPLAGLKREFARNSLSKIKGRSSEKFNYEAGSRRDRMGGWIPVASGPNSSMSLMKTVIARTRDLVRNNSYAAKAERSIVAHVIGKGIKLQAKHKDKKIAQSIENAFKEWANSKMCDANEKLSFAGIQRQVMKTIFTSGEVLIRRRRRRTDSGMKYPLQLQVLESDYLDESKDYQTLDNGNYVRKGIEFNSKGQAVAYHLFKEHPSEQVFRRDLGTVRVPAKDIIHLFRVDRPGQIRGVPWLAPAVVQLKDFADYESTQLIRQKIAACFMAFVHDIDTEDAISGLSKTEEGELLDKMTPAMMEVLPAGRDITFANPPAVNGDYDKYSTQILRGIAAGAGVPYEILTGDFSQVNFSSARMAFLAFYRDVVEWQDDLFISGFLPSVWEWFSEILDIYLFDVENTQASWIPQKREMVDPAKEIKAAKDEVRSGFNSLSGTIREMGRDPDEVFEEIAQDNKALDKLGIVLDSDPRRITQSGQSQADQELDAESKQDEN